MDVASSAVKLESKFSNMSYLYTGPPQVILNDINTDYLFENYHRQSQLTTKILYSDINS
jgi:hypothetical protein